jgi:metal-sulfur cluster biosynthetic enzyme
MATMTLTAEDVLESLTRVLHPAIGINIVDLGLVYGIEVGPAATIIQMTLMTANDPDREGVVEEIHEVLRRRHPGLDEAIVDLVWDPPWREDFITPEGQLQRRSPIMQQRPTADAPLTEAHLRESLKVVIDPEVGINVVDLGLVYGVAVDGTRARVTMTLTTRGCPLHASIEAAVKRTLETRHPELSGVEVVLVWEPAWDTDMITDEGRRALGW